MNPAFLEAEATSSEYGRLTKHFEQQRLTTSCHFRSDMLRGDFKTSS
jgi:hypothetical protein